MIIKYIKKNEIRILTIILITEIIIFIILPEFYASIRENLSDWASGIISLVTLYFLYMNIKTQEYTYTDNILTPFINNYNQSINDLTISESKTITIKGTKVFCSVPQLHFNNHKNIVNYCGCKIEGLDFFFKSLETTVNNINKFKNKSNCDIQPYIDILEIPHTSLCKYFIFTYLIDNDNSSLLSKLVEFKIITPYKIKICLHGFIEFLIWMSDEMRIEKESNDSLDRKYFEMKFYYKKYLKLLLLFNKEEILQTYTITSNYFGKPLYLCDKKTIQFINNNITHEYIDSLIVF